jgi:hypothetical protein
VSYPGIQDLLLYVGVPLAVIGLIYVLVYASGSRGAKRYRPGRPYDFAPVWFLARPETDGPAAVEHAAGHAAVTSGGAHLASIEAAPVAVVAPKSAGLTGGASDRW